MNVERDEAMGTVVGIAAVLTAGGVLTFGLFPLLLPTVALLAVLALPLGIVAALLVPVYLLVRSLVRLARRDRRSSRRHSGAPTQAERSRRGRSFQTLASDR